ncbi:MAG: KpsF/GutQ family sugar-phosphate isomerase [Gammaproteobacteria bacterium]|nr:MAG: KpsF/GutQ family sugar-phosphate isomerase [Gammaproteobacteria bacterium]
MTENQLVNNAIKALETESEAITNLIPRIGDDFIKACEIILTCTGKVIVTGMGKSGHIGCKIAATLASTGTPAFFVHPAEASHGDLGMITKDDVVLAISNSGETDEILTIIPMFKRINTSLITMTGNINSSLATAADANLDISVETEACPLNLAPTSSTTATLAMGDAIAVSLLKAKGFTEDDFAMSHPGGKLGRKLLLTVEQLMHTGDLVPSVKKDVLLRDALMEMTKKGLGITAITDTKNNVLGIFTDGDLRRILDKEISVHNTIISDVMTPNCITVTKNMLAAKALAIMEGKKINALLVVDESNKLIGALNMHDMLKAKVV